MRIRAIFLSRKTSSKISSKLKYGFCSTCVHKYDFNGRASSSHKSAFKLSNGSKLIFFEHFKLKFRRQHGYSLLPLRNLGFQKRPLNLLHNFSVPLLRSVGKDLNEAECFWPLLLNEKERFQSQSKTEVRSFSCCIRTADLVPSYYGDCVSGSRKVKRYRSNLKHRIILVSLHQPLIGKISDLHTVSSTFL